jgi:hypothetical protein
MESIKYLREDLQNEIEQKMADLTEGFKSYTIGDHKNYPKHVITDGVWYRNNYGRDQNENFYVYLPDFVTFIYKNKVWNCDVIYYNDNNKIWYVYDKEQKTYMPFNNMNIDSQIMMLEMLIERIGTYSETNFMDLL